MQIFVCCLFILLRYLSKKKKNLEPAVFYFNEKRSSSGECEIDMGCVIEMTSLWQVQYTHICMSELSNSRIMGFFSPLIIYIFNQKLGVTDSLNSNNSSSLSKFNLIRDLINTENVLRGEWTWQKNLSVNVLFTL